MASKTINIRWTRTGSTLLKTFRFYISSIFAKKFFLSLSKLKDIINCLKFLPILRNRDKYTHKKRSKNKLIFFEKTILDGTLGCLVHLSERSYNNVFLFVG